MFLHPVSNLEWYETSNSKTEERAGEMAHWVTAMATVWTKTALSASTWWLTAFMTSVSWDLMPTSDTSTGTRHTWSKETGRTSGPSKHACYQAQ